MDWQSLLPYVFPVLLIALVARRVLRAQAPQPVRTGRLWIAPVYLAFAMALVLASSPIPGGTAVALYAVGALAGVGVGYLRALHQEFSVDPDTGQLMSKASPLGSLLFVGLFLMRFALNYWMSGGMPKFGAPPAHTGQLVLYTDTMLFFAFAMVAASAFEVWRRTRPLAAARAAADGAEPPA